MTETRIQPGEWDRAVATTDGPQLIVAGPGTGKTEFLVRRATHLIGERGLAPEHLLVLTFSRRAAADLRRRIEGRIARSTVGIPASTFHSFAFRLLELHAPNVFGWSQLPSILTGPEQVALVAALLADEDPAAWPVPYRAMLTTRTFAEETADFIMRAQERLLTPEALSRRADERTDWRAMPAFLRRYRDRLGRDNRIDYGTLQAQAVRLLDDLTVRAQVADQYRYVLVDEYQDTTVAQAGLLDGLTAVRRNLTVAADPYQSVYSFRGAELNNVSDFPEQFRALSGEPAARIVLDTSFRVSAEILEAAERLAGRELPGGAGPITAAPHRGRVDVHVFDQLSAEADWIAAEVQRLNVEEAVPLHHIAVLVRTKRRILPELSRALDRRGLAHDKPDSRLVDHPAIRLLFDCVALATACDPDVDAIATRVLLGPLFETTIGKQRELIRLRARTNLAWAEIFRAHVDGGGPLGLLLANPEWVTRMPATEGFWHIWTTLPQFASLVARPELADHRAAWTSFSQALARLADRDPAMTLQTYVEMADADDFEATPMLSYRSPSDSRLTLTTLHQAKGLEFEVVFIADAVEGVFPDLRRRHSVLQTERLSDRPPEEAKRDRLHEEMRLAYTAMTRARRRVTWTATEAGLDEGDARPSRFLITVAGTGDASRLRPPPAGSRAPVTIGEAEAVLRSTVADPSAPASARLAAAATLVGASHPGLRDPATFALMRRPGASSGVLAPPFRLSPSQAEAYELCPRRYVLERRLQIGAEQNVYMAFGSLIHEVLEAAERTAIDERRRSTLAEALAVLDERFPDYDFGPGAWREGWRRRAERCLHSLYEHWPRPQDRAVLLEHELEIDIGGIEWRGIADRIETAGDGKLRIVDYKTATRPPTAAEASVSLQLGFYLLAARHDAQVCGHGEPTEAEYWYPMKREGQGKPVVLDPERIDEVEQRLALTAAALASEDWTPRPNDRCDGCRVRILCPEWPDGKDAFVR